MKTFLLTISVFAAISTAATTANAADYKGITYSIEPIIGYELQRKEAPTRKKLVLTYGARVIAGYKILSGEGEYTQGRSDEFFSDINTRIEEKTEKFRAGLRSSYTLGTMLDWHLRGGAEAQKTHTKSTLNGAVTETDSPSKVYPYVGTGVAVHLGTHLSLNAGILATLKDLNDFKQTEYSTTLGVSIH